MKINIRREWNSFWLRWEWLALVTGVPCGWYRMVGPSWQSVVDELCKVDWSQC